MFKRFALALLSALAVGSATLPAVTAHAQAADSATCSDASDGLVLGDFAECFYNAVGTSGDAIGEAVGPLPMEIDITVQDLTSGGASVASCKATGTGTVDVSCPYPETVGHQYDVTATDPTFNDVVLTLVAEG